MYKIHRKESKKGGCTAHNTPANRFLGTYTLLTAITQQLHHKVHFLCNRSMSPSSGLHAAEFTDHAIPTHGKRLARNRARPDAMNAYPRVPRSLWHRRTPCLTHFVETSSIESFPMASASGASFFVMEMSSCCLSSSRFCLSWTGDGAISGSRSPCS